MEVWIQFLRDNWLVLLVMGGLAVAWLLLRTPGDDLGSIEEFDRQVSTGRPVVVEFFSNT